MGILVMKPRIQAACDCCGFQLITCALWFQTYILIVPCSDVIAFGIWILDFNWEYFGIIYGWLYIMEYINHSMSVSFYIFTFFSYFYI